MIYHVSFPHHPFLEMFVDNFEKIFPNQNRFILVTSPDNENDRCDVDESLIVFKGPLCNKVIDLINNKNCHGICVYWLNKDLMTLVSRIEKNKPIYWRSYGPDIKKLIYDNKDTKKFLEPLTKKLMEPNIFLRNTKDFSRSAYLFVWKKLKLKNYISFIERISMIGTVSMYEYSLLKEKHPYLDIERVSIGYYQKKLSQGFPCRYQNDIMIGHSSFNLHNHVDVFKKIKDMDWNNSNLVVPLSYGNKTYAKKISDIGEAWFPDRFKPIHHYLPLEKYNTIVFNCGTFILNSYLQQGGANIIQFLKVGGKIYLHHKNPLYIDFKNYGIKIFSVQKDLDYDHLYNYKLTEEDAVNNRKLIMSLHHGKDKVESNFKKISKLFQIEMNCDFV